MIRDILLGSVGAFGGTFGMAYLLHSPKKVVIPCSLTGLGGYLVFVLCFKVAGLGEIFGYFLGTVVVTFICEIAARIMRMPATIFLLPSLVPLVPGYQFYCAMLGLVQDDGTFSASYGMEAVQIVAAIAVGAAVTSALFRTLSVRKKNTKL